MGREVWDKFFGTRRALNFGVGGDSTQNALWRLEHMDIAALRPRVAVIMLGMNNAGDTPEDIAAGVHAVIQKTRSLYSNAKIIVMSVTANGRMPDKTPAINNLLAALADNRTIFYLDIYSEMTPENGGWKRRWRRPNSPDCRGL